MVAPSPIVDADPGSEPCTDRGLRDPAEVMRLSRLGSFHQCRLSFMRQLTRRLARERWTFERTAFALDSNGIGHAVYTARGPERSYSLVAFAHDLPDEARSDRVIAEAWDATFALFDGVPSATDLRRLAANVPRQEAGRLSDAELSLSRANRSVRLFDHVVGRLAAGQQPDIERVDATGYLMRTTAVYGSGKFGAADREFIAARPEFAAPFQVEMLNVYLIRVFVRDLVEHLAAMRGGEMATTLAPDIARRLGIGNSTGLGMAPFIVNHPLLFNNWIRAREEALARVRAVQEISPDARAVFDDVLTRTRRLVAGWRTADARQAERIDGLQGDLARLAARWEATASTTPEAGGAWEPLYRFARAELGEEAQECLVSLLLEPYPALVDEWADAMSNPLPELAAIDGRMTVADLIGRIEAVHGWALQLDWTERDRIARAWYVSAEKLEPRLGERFEEPIEPYEQPLAPARDAVALHAALQAWPHDATVADVLLQAPEHRHAARRAQMTANAPFAEIRDNTIDADMRPIDMLRCKLSFFGATRFDPRSDRWLRICLFGNAPYPDELLATDADRWIYPPVDDSPEYAAGLGSTG